MSLSAVLSAHLIRPWALPAGLAGRIAGWEMAHGKREIDDRVAELLAPAPTDRLLEVGFGPGTTLARLARSVPAGRVVGVDPSIVMFRQAERRNRAAIDAGRAELHVARAERLPFGDACFDKALTLHSLGHWAAPDRGLAELHRVLKPGGVLVVGLRAGHATETIESTRATITGAGFDLARAPEPPRARRTSTLVFATRRETDCAGRRAATSREAHGSRSEPRRAAPLRER
jgi:SAM-dependent methyltransferase